MTITIQKTGKGIKATKAVSGTLFFIGVFVIFTDNVNIGMALTGIGAIGVMVARVMRWWEHD